LTRTVLIIQVLIESAHATSYWPLVITVVWSCLVYRFRDIVA